MWHLFVLGVILCFSGRTFGQTVSGVNSNGQTYLCLQTGTTCPTGGSSGTGGDTIDPRIVTPTGGGGGPSPISQCPTGTFPCYGRTVPCGTRLATVRNTADGLADFGAYPWQAYLRNNTNSFAGSGVLLDAFHVLTAAHKVYRNQANPQSITVYMGVWNPNNLVNVQSSTVSRITIAGNFNASLLTNDIAILTLTQPIVLGLYSNINTICLPPAGSTSTSYVGQRCLVSGWGQTSFNTFDAPTNPQKQVTVPIVSYATCRQSFSQANVLGNNVDRYLDPNGEICAGGDGMKDACTQDGGSPLVCPSPTGTFSLAGLVIWGKNCGMPGVYGVYVSVPSYLNFIQSNLAAAG